MASVYRLDGRLYPPVVHTQNYHPATQLSPSMLGTDILKENSFKAYDVELGDTTISYKSKKSARFFTVFGNDHLFSHL